MMASDHRVTERERVMCVMQAPPVHSPLPPVGTREIPNIPVLPLGPSFTAPITHTRRPAVTPTNIVITAIGLVATAGRCGSL